MLTEITLDGKTYPISFGWRARWDFEKATGENALAIAELSSMKFARLCFYAFKAGHRQEGIEMNFDIMEMMDLLDRTKGSMQKLQQALVDALEAEDEEKKESQVSSPK